MALAITTGTMNMMSTLCASLIALVVQACQPAAPITPAPSPIVVPPLPAGEEWGAPEIVTIRDYAGAAQDPFITGDGRRVLFDTHSDAKGTRAGGIYYADMIDYKTFGPATRLIIEGLPAGTGAAAPAVDDSGNFCFLTPWFAMQGSTIACGVLAGGTVTDASPVKGINLGGGNMGAAPSRDGNLLIFSDNTSKTSRVAMAGKSAAGSFARLPESAAILAAVNGRADIAYGASLSPDTLEIFWVSPPSIYTAKRVSAAEPFGAPRIVPTHSDGTLVEGPSLAPDGVHFYFHRVTGVGSSQINVMTRSPAR